MAVDSNNDLPTKLHLPRFLIVEVGYKALEANESCQLLRCVPYVV